MLRINLYFFNIIDILFDMKILLFKIGFLIIGTGYLLYTLFGYFTPTNDYSLKNHDSILVSNKSQREILSDRDNSGTNEYIRNNYLIDTISTYKEYIGKIGAKSIKLHLFKNKNFENLFTGSYYTLGGNNFKLLIGEIQFIISNKTYESSYHASSMFQEINYRNNSAFIDEYISMIEDNNEDNIPLRFKGKVNEKGIFSGYIYSDNDIIDTFNLKEVSSFYPYLVTCYDNHNSIDGVIPSLIEHRTQIGSNCINLKTSLLSDSLSLLISPQLINEIYSNIDTFTEINVKKYSYSVIYNEGDNLAIALNMFKSKQKHNAYNLKILNYDIKNKKIISLEDVFIKNYENKLLNFINIKTNENNNNSNKFNNFIITNKGIVVFLERKEKSYYSQYGRSIYFSFRELKEILK